MLLDRQRAVVADGDPLIRALLRDLLTTMGYDVTACASGRAALGEIYAAEPELLVAEMRMSALDVIRDLRAKRILLPILLTGLDDHPDLPAALSHSGVSFLPKPFRVGECRKAVRGAVGARR